jgi:ATP-dependent DNA helicase RecG
VISDKQQVMDIESIIHKGEGIDVEFKESYDQLSRSVYETICSFLNRKGGVILLGVSDNGEISGVNENTIKNQLDTLERDLNNMQLINPTCNLTTEVVSIKDKKIIYVYVPESSQVHTYKGIIFDRKQDGDFKLRNQQQITNLYVRKQDGYTENKVFPYLTIDDFELKQFDEVRKLVRLTRTDHPWLRMTNEELLVSARLRLRDVHTGKDGYTLAAALLFGTENTLAWVLPHYKTDAICRIENPDRYDDRDDVRCNLFESYSRLLAFVRKHLPDRFYLEGNQRMSIRELIFREIVANMLIHREFSNAFPAKLIINAGNVVTENWNKPNLHDFINPQNLQPFPKNPTIANFFKQLGWVEELGSGVRNLYKYCPLYYSNALPLIEDGDVFKVTISYSHEIELENSQIELENPKIELENTEIVLEKIVKNSNISFSNKEKLILRELILNSKITNNQLSQIIGITPQNIRIHISKLKAKGIIERIGPDKGGYWKVNI